MAEYAYESWNLRAINDEMETVTLCQLVAKHEDLLNEAELRSVDG